MSMYVALTSLESPTCAVLAPSASFVLSVPDSMSYLYTVGLNQRGIKIVGQLTADG